MTTLQEHFLPALSNKQGRYSRRYFWIAQSCLAVDRFANYWKFYKPVCFTVFDYFESRTATKTEIDGPTVEARPFLLQDFIGMMCCTSL